MVVVSAVPPQDESTAPNPPADAHGTARHGCQLEKLPSAYRSPVDLRP